MNTNIISNLQHKPEYAYSEVSLKFNGIYLFIYVKNFYPAFLMHIRGTQCGLLLDGTG